MNKPSQTVYENGNETIILLRVGTVSRSELPVTLLESFGEERSEVTVAYTYVHM